MGYIYLINQAVMNGFEDISSNVKPERVLNIVKQMQELDLKMFMGHAFYYDFIKWIENSGFATAANVAGHQTTSAPDNNYINQPLTTFSGVGVGGRASFIVVNGIVTTVTQVASGSGYIVGDQFTCDQLPGALFTVVTLSDNVAFNNETPQQYMDLFYGKSYIDRRGHKIIYEGLIPTLVYFTFARFIESDAYRFTATGPVVKNHDNADALKKNDITFLVQMKRSIANAHCNEVQKFLYDNRQDYPLWRFSSKEKTARQAGPRIRGIDRNNFNSPTGGGYGYNLGYDYFDIGGNI